MIIILYPFVLQFRWFFILSVFLTLKNAIFLSFSAYLGVIDWPNAFACNICSTNEDFWNLFATVLRKGIELFVPKRSIRVNSFCNVFPKPLRKKQAMRRKLWRKLKKSPTQANRIAYQRSSVSCKLAIQQFFVERESAVLNSGRPNAFYDYVRTNMKVKRRIDFFKQPDGSLVEEPVEQAKMFNEFFVSVHTSDDGVIPTFDVPSLVSRTSDVCFSPAVVLSALKRVKSICSAGIDGFPNILYKKLAVGLAFPLSKIFEKSFLTGSVPNEWKVSIVTPIFKNGSPLSVSNYRPVSLTCVACRVMERIILDELLRNFLCQNLLIEDQHGFLPHLSTVTNLLRVFQSVSFNFSKKFRTDIVYIDFAKAFDKVSHPKLMRKLHAYGVSGSLFSWIESFIFERVQRVKVCNSFSTDLSVRSGVPQGSVLGPFLFLIYVNDIFSCVVPPVKPAFYEDDLKLFVYVHSDSDIQCLNESLNLLYEWSVKWQLPISRDKCFCLTICREKPLLAYILCNTALKQVELCKDLGVSIDSCLSFKQHYQNIVAEANQIMFLLF